MALPGDKSPLIKQGWIRAIFLLIIYVGLSLVAGFAIGFFIPSDDQIIAPLKGALNQTDMQIWLTMAFLIALGSVAFFRKFIDRKPLTYLAPGFSFFHPEGTLGLLLGTFLVCTGAFSLFLAGQLQWTDISFNLADISISLVLMIMVAIGEEWVFRGYLLHNLLESFNKWVALGISALLFAIVHGNNPGVQPVALINVFLAGLLMGLSYIRSGSIWFPVCLHFSWNFLQGPVLGFPVSGLPVRSIFILETEGHPLLTGGAFGFEASIICAVMLAIAFAAIYFFYSPGALAGNIPQKSALRNTQKF